MKKIFIPIFLVLFFAGLATAMPPSPPATPPSDTAYGASWDSNTNAPTKNAVYDQIQNVVAGAGGQPLDDDLTALAAGGASGTIAVGGATASWTTNPTFSTANVYGTGVTVGTGSATTGTVQFKNSTNNNIFTIQPGVTGAALSWTLPIAAAGGGNFLLNVDADGTMGYTDPATFAAGAGDFKADGTVPMTAAIVPNAANTIAIGSAAAEWANLYLGDSAIIYGQNNQGNTITSAATGWAFNLPVTIGVGSSADGSVKFQNATNNNVFTIQPGVTGAALSWTLPTAAAGGANYLLNVDADGTMGYTDPATLGSGGTPTAITVADTTDATSYVGLFESATGDLGPKTDAGITYNATTGILTTTGGFTGPLTQTGITVTSEITNFPAATAGAIYKVTTSDGNPAWLGGAAPDGEVVNNGDLLICVTTTAGGSKAVVGSDWNIQRRIISQPNQYRYVELATNTTTAPTGVTNGYYWLDNVMYMIENSVHRSVVAEGKSTGGVILGDSTPDAAGELGYASNQLSVYDGTASRSLLQVASTEIAKSEYLPIRYAEDDDSVTAPAATAEIGTTTMIGRSFVEDADNGVVFWWHVPLDYSSGIKYRVYYAIQTDADADETVAFALSGCAIIDLDSIACSEGTAVNVTDELGTTYDANELIVSGWSTAVTIGGTPAAGKLAKLLFIRDVSEDDYAGASDNVLVIAIEIKYLAKVNAIGDY